MKTTEQIILEKIDALHKELDEKMEFIMKYIPKTDIVTNERFCQIRTEMGAPLKYRGLIEWFQKPGFPRVSKSHLSVSDANKYIEEHSSKTKKAKA